MTNPQTTPAASHPDATEGLVANLERISGWIGRDGYAGECTEALVSLLPTILAALAQPKPAEDVELRKLLKEARLFVAYPLHERHPNRAPLLARIDAKLGEG